MNKRYDFFTKHSKKNCLLYFGKQNVCMKNINLSNNADFFRCIKHLENRHSGKFFTDRAAQFDINIKNPEPSEHLAIIRQFNDLYYVIIKVKEYRLCIKVYRINSKHYVYRHDKFIAEFQYKDTTLVKYGNVGYNKRHVVENSNETSWEGLRSVFPDVDNIQITIRIEILVTCNRCSTVAVLSHTEVKYILNENWNCMNCVNVIRRRCFHRWENCEFEDIDVKLKKHSLFFCLFRNICYICRASVRSEDGGPIAHYRDKHQNITHLTDTTFRLPATLRRQSGQYCLLEYQNELLVCRYYLDENELQFAIRSPWEQDHIKRMRCFMTLTVKSETKTYEMLKSLNSFDDWYIHLNNWTFVKWYGEFDVSITFETIPL